VPVGTLDDKNPESKDALLTPDSKAVTKESVSEYKLNGPVFVAADVKLIVAENGILYYFMMVYI
jgi:hypothetical protein